jgi:hypothetical protein
MRRSYRGEIVELIMAIGEGTPGGMEGQGSSDTGNGGGGAPPAPGMTPPQEGGPILAALQRQSMGPQASSPGPGNMADSLGKLKIAIDLMQSALHGFDAGSKQYGDILSALKSLSRHLPQSGPESGLQQTHLIDLLRRGKQNPVLQAISSLMGGGGGKGNGEGGPSPPMPSMPLPGA